MATNKINWRAFESVPCIAFEKKTSCKRLITCQLNDRKYICAKCFNPTFVQIRIVSRNVRQGRTLFSLSYRPQINAFVFCFVDFACVYTFNKQQYQHSNGNSTSKSNSSDIPIRAAQFVVLSCRVMCPLCPFRLHFATR